MIVNKMDQVSKLIRGFNGGYRIPKIVAHDVAPDIIFELLEKGVIQYYGEYYTSPFSVDYLKLKFDRADTFDQFVQR